MILRIVALGLIFLSPPAFAQDVFRGPLPDLGQTEMPDTAETPATEGTDGIVTEAPEDTTDRVAPASGAVVRVLDRLTGEVTDAELANGQSVTIGRIEIAQTECRHPVESPASDAFAYLTIREAGAAQPVFAGWMIASSPALSALDHPRYDVWVLRCSSN